MKKKEKQEKTKDILKNSDRDHSMVEGEILNIREVSDYLKIPTSTIYKLIQEGKIPAIKLGKHWRVMKKDIDRLFVEKTGVGSWPRAKGGGAHGDSAKPADVSPEEGREGGGRP